MAKATAKLLIQTEGATEAIKDVDKLVRPLEHIESLLAAVSRALGISEQKAKTAGQKYREMAKDQKLAAQIAKQLQAEMQKTAQAANKAAENTKKIGDKMGAIHFNAWLSIAKKTSQTIQKIGGFLWDCVDAYGEVNSEADDNLTALKEIKADIEASKAVIGQIIASSLGKWLDGIKGKVDIVGGVLYAAGAVVIKIVEYAGYLKNAFEIAGKTIYSAIAEPLKKVGERIANTLGNIANISWLPEGIKEQLRDVSSGFAEFAAMQTKWKKEAIESLGQDLRDVETISKTSENALAQWKKIVATRARALPDKKKDDDDDLKKHKKKLKAMSDMDDKYRSEKLSKDKAAVDELSDYEKAQAQTLIEWKNSLRSNIESTLSGSITSLFDTAIEGTNAWRDSLYGTFKSFAQNIFTTSLSSIVKSVVEWAVNGGKAMAGIPIVGPVLAAATSAGILATMAAFKAKAGGKAQVSYANGGYISQGFVRGAFTGSDSVQAALKPGERVLSKREAEEYDKGQTKAAPVINISVSIAGGFDRAAIDRETRQYLIPAIKRAVNEGYSLA